MVNPDEMYFQIGAKRVVGVFGARGLSKELSNLSNALSNESGYMSKNDD